MEALVPWKLVFGEETFQVRLHPRGMWDTVSVLPDFFSNKDEYKLKQLGISYYSSPNGKNQQHNEQQMTKEKVGKSKTSLTVAGIGNWSSHFENQWEEPSTG